MMSHGNNNNNGNDEDPPQDPGFGDWVKLKSKDEDSESDSFSHSPLKQENGFKMRLENFISPFLVVLLVFLKMRRKESWELFL